MKPWRRHAALWAALGVLAFPLRAAEPAATATAVAVASGTVTAIVTEAPAGSLEGNAQARPARVDSIPALARAIRAAHGTVDASLGSLGGGPLTLALVQAARDGRRLRVLLDPQDEGSREQGRILAQVSPTARVRWGGAIRFRRRWLELDGYRQVVWYAGEPLRRVHSEAAEERFERAWALAGRSLSPELYLNDQLNALPDPRDLSPHFVRRAFGATP